MCNICLGLFSPLKHELKEYMGYDISILKDNIRFLEVLVNRGGTMGGIIALYFNGACCYFQELPKPGTPELKSVYSSILNKAHKSFMAINKKSNKLIAINKKKWSKFVAPFYKLKQLIKYD